MRVIVGLGNPGPRYDGTRHNIGFATADAIANHGGIALRSAGEALVGEGRIDSHPVLVVKPTTFMNLSGAAVAPILDRAEVGTGDLVVLHDELDLPLGKLKVKGGGGTGGHRGLDSIVEEVGGADFARIRLGIGRPAPGQEVVDFVLERFSGEESAVADRLVDRGVAAARAWLELGLATAMNQMNGLPSVAEAAEDGGNAPKEASRSASEPRDDG